jgi:predicted dehydrogenase
MIHDIDLVLSLIKSDVEKIDVTGTPVLSPTEDIVNARLQFANGSCAVLTASRISATPMRRIQILQEDGTFSMDLGNPAGIVSRFTSEGIVSEEVTLPAVNALANELDDFLCAVRSFKATANPADTKVSALQGLRALELATAIEKEARRYNGQYSFSIKLK